MSLLNLIVHADRAFVITDSGHYRRPTGSVSRLGPKSMVLENLGLVIATAGTLQCGHIASVLQGRHETLLQEQFLAELPGIAGQAVAAFKIDAGTVVAVAGYSTRASRPFGIAFAITPDHCGKIAPKNALLSPSADAIDEKALIDDTFDPFVDMMPLIEQQRLFNFGTADAPICGIAGDIDVVTVSAAGYDMRTIHTYPASVGEKVRFQDTSWPPHQAAGEVIRPIPKTCPSRWAPS